MIDSVFIQLYECAIARRCSLMRLLNFLWHILQDKYKLYEQNFCSFLLVVRNVLHSGANEHLTIAVDIIRHSNIIINIAP